MDWQTPDEAIKRHMQAQEELLWSGRPGQGIKFHGYDVFMIPFSLLWCGFALFWEVMALGIGRGSSESEAPFIVSLIFPLFGLPFVLIGLYLVFGRFIVDAKQRAKTFYGVTNDRVIILSGLFSQKVKSLNIKTLSDITMHQKRDGSGTITLGPSNPFNFWGGSFAWPGMRQTANQFEMIPKVVEVYNIITDAQKPHE